MHSALELPPTNTNYDLNSNGYAVVSSDYEIEDEEELSSQSPLQELYLANIYPFLLQLKGAEYVEVFCARMDYVFYLLNYRFWFWVANKPTSAFMTYDCLHQKCELRRIHPGVTCVNYEDHK